MGSIRNDQPDDFNGQFNGAGCVPGYNAGQMLGRTADNIRTTPFPQNTAGWHVKNNPQEIVGPHVNAHLRWTRALDDMNGDGIRDVAVGSTEVQSEFWFPVGPAGHGTPDRKSGVEG